MNIAEEREGLIRLDPEEAKYCSELLDEIERLNDWIDYFGMAAGLESDNIRSRQIEAIKQGAKLSEFK